MLRNRQLTIPPTLDKNKWSMSVKNLLIIALGVFTLSTFAQRKSFVGLYGECPKGYFVCTQLELKSDSTFEYYVFFDVGGATIKKGTWVAEEDTLILNTFNQPKFARGYKILDTAHSDNKKIYCLDRDSVPIFYGTIVINHSDTITLDENGKAIYNGEIKNIQVSGLMTQKSDFTVNFSNYSEIEFFVDNFVCHNPDYLTNEKLIINGNEIKEYYHCHEKFADKGLKKTSIKNKRFK